MKAANPSMASDCKHDGWMPLLALAVGEVFEMMLGCHLTEPTAEPFPPLNITSMVGLAGQLCGVLSVRCHESAAVLMASKMLGIELDKVGANFSDASGEICNMVAGNFKNKIAGLGDGCMLSSPTVIVGNDYRTFSPLAESPALELRLLFEGLPMLITLEIHS
jgi:chemotaxis protein CheX